MELEGSDDGTRNMMEADNRIPNTRSKALVARVVALRQLVGTNRFTNGFDKSKSQRR